MRSLMGTGALAYVVSFSAILCPRVRTSRVPVTPARCRPVWTM